MTALDAPPTALPAALPIGPARAQQIVSALEQLLAPDLGAGAQDRPSDWAPAVPGVAEPPD